MTVHLKKLCVGAQDVDDLFRRQTFIREKYNETIHITRMYPKRYEELINGGSIYWIFKGYIRARQNILDMNRYIGEDKISRCKIFLSEDIVLTVPKKSRPFQGWRYLKNNDTNAAKDKYNFVVREYPNNTASSLALQLLKNME